MPTKQRVEIVVGRTRYDLRCLSDGKLCVYRDGKMYVRHGDRECSHEIEDFMYSLAGNESEVYFYTDSDTCTKMEVYDRSSLDAATVHVRKFFAEQFGEWAKIQSS